VVDLMMAQYVVQ